MTFDYNQYLSDSDYIKFAQVGDAVIGIIKEVRGGKDFNGNPCPELILEVTDEEGNVDEKTLTAGQARLKVLLAEKMPQAGDKIRITYSGNTPGQPGRAPAKEFTLDVKPGPHEMAHPAVTNTEAPF